MFAPYRRLPYAMLLLSGGGLDCASHSLMGWDPFLVMEAKGSQVRIARGTECIEVAGNPFDMLEELLGALEIPGPTPLAPFAAGGLGFLAYDLKNHLERLPTTAQDDLNLPDLVWAFPRRLVVHDRLAGRFWSVEIIWEDRRGVVSRPAGEGPPLTGPEPDRFRVGRLQSNFSREAYLKAVRRIREYIRHGDVYQVNLSQRFSFPLPGSPIRCSGGFSISTRRRFTPTSTAGISRCFSTSMERFLLRRGDYLETRPIKGTRPRGATPAEDEAQRQELLASPKDDAELSMIVDLLAQRPGEGL